MSAYEIHPESEGVVPPPTMIAATGAEASVSYSGHKVAPCETWHAADSLRSVFLCRAP